MCKDSKTRPGSFKIIMWFLYIDSQCCQFYIMFSLLHITLNTITELMSDAEIMSGAKSRKWVHQKPTNQPTILNHFKSKYSIVPRSGGSQNTV